eukprot:5232765-Lingulodinium_polyedra.AAC.1
MASGFQPAAASTRTMSSWKSREALRVPYMARRSCQTKPGRSSPRGGTTQMSSSMSACQNATSMS